MDEQELIAHEPLGLDGHQRIFADQTMEPLLYIHLQAKFLGRAGGDLDIFHFARIHAIHSYFRAFGKAIHILEIGVENDVTVKRFVLIADQKESSAEEHDGGGNENPTITLWFFMRLALRYELLQPVVVRLIQFLRCAEGQEPALDPKRRTCRRSCAPHEYRG
jgi:hypothetical protein